MPLYILYKDLYYFYNNNILIIKYYNFSYLIKTFYNL
jgi:hypothetical protein